MGKVLRVTLCFRERFWKSLQPPDQQKTLADLRFLFSDDEYFPTWWTQMPERSPMMTGWSPPHCAERMEGMTDGRIVDRALDLLAQYAPNIRGVVEHVHALSPLDLEQEYGLTGGNIFHGELSLDQLFSLRPVAGWARYATPIRDLYLCGSGTHPGGGVTGAPGYNAAREILRHRSYSRQAEG